MAIPVLSCLENLSRKRPLFHSEADFQHALAWEIQKRIPEARIRLEIRPNARLREYIDVWVEHDNERHAIELKYKTRLLSATVQGEAYSLANQAAQDLARYDFFKDIQRLERLVASSIASDGWAIFLTNDPTYWTSGRGGSVDLAFRIEHGRSASGTLAWGSHASSGTTRGREAELALSGIYDLVWSDYSRVSKDSAGTFRCAALQIAQPSTP